ncbi:hypothetical protein BGW42_000563 [Actinomortierella wolfii]|nr:hypothetical protein BGW42_000563 [Actinomortierella wolfii]
MSDSTSDDAYMAMLTRNIPGVGQQAAGTTPSTLVAHTELTPLQDSALNVLAKAAEKAIYVTEGEAKLEPVCIPASLLAQTETSMSPTWLLRQQQQQLQKSGEPGVIRRSSLTSHHLPSPSEFVTILQFLKNTKTFSALLASLPPPSPSSETPSDSGDGNVQCEVVSDIRSVLHPSDPGMSTVFEALWYLFLTKPNTNASVADAPVPTATLPSMSTQLRHQEPKNGHLSPSTATLDVHEAQHRYLAAYRVYIRGSTRVQVWILGAINDGSLVGYYTTAIET